MLYCLYNVSYKLNTKNNAIKKLVFICKLCNILGLLYKPVFMGSLDNLNV